MLCAITDLLCDERGATLVEYGLLLLLVALVVISVLGTIGGRVSSMFSNAGNEF